MSLKSSRLTSGWFSKDKIITQLAQQARLVKTVHSSRGRVSLGLEGFVRLVVIYQRSTARSMSARVSSSHT
jgi:hypothetical protein